MKLLRTLEVSQAQQNSSLDYVFENGRKEPRNDLDIAVMSANVDCKRYIAATSGKRQHSVPPRSACSNKSRTWLQHDSSAWEEAVEFEISITLNGRTYTRRRSFPRIVRLRNELIKEVRNRQKNHPGRFGVLRSFLFDGASSNEQGKIQEKLTPEQQKPKENEVLFDDDNGEYSTTNLCDVQGLSLTKMQSTLNGRYCPAIETWLQSVSSEIVDPHTSPTLTEFLKEDNVSRNASVLSMKSQKKTRKRRQKCSQLWSIQEDRPCIHKDDISIADNFPYEDGEDRYENNDNLFVPDGFDEDNECEAYFSAI